MAENYMQLLTTGAQVTSDVFNRVDQAMSKNLEVRSEAQKFAVGMTAKAAEFAEETRMNDANIQNMQQDNYLRGQEFALEQQLAPLKVQESILRLEAYKAQAADRVKANQFNNFNSIVKGYEPVINNHLLKTMNPDMANEFAQYRGKYMANVANGGGFSGEDYQKGLDKIISKYSGSKPSERPWSATDRFMLAQISPDLAAAYDQQNPILKQHRNGLAASYLTEKEEQAAKFVQYRTLYSDEEWGAMSLSRRQVQANLNQMKEYDDEEARLRARMALTTDPEELSNHTKVLKTFTDKRQELLEMNMNMVNNHSLGKYGMTAKPIVDDAKKEPEPEHIDTASYLDKKETVLNIPISKDSFVKEMRLKANDIAAIVTKGYGDNVDPQETELKNVGFEWFVNKGDGKRPDVATMFSIKKKIQDNLDALGNIGDRFTKETTEAILEKIPVPVSVPISIALADSLHKATGASMSAKIYSDRDNIFAYNPDMETAIPFMRFGGSSKSIVKDSFTSFEQLMDVVKKLPRLEREGAEKEIYAAILTAPLSNIPTE